MDLPGGGGGRARAEGGGGGEAWVKGAWGEEEGEERAAV